AGAPLEESEKEIIDRVVDIIKPYLSAAALATIEQKGHYVWNEEFGWVTPTVDSDKEICAYGIRLADGTIQCGFEKAHTEKKIDWKKPISCHLYPITAKPGKHGDYERVNYEPREQLCASGCSLGEKLQVPVYQFLKEPIVRKWGLEFWQALDTIAKGEWEEIDFKE
ncbi:MAG TPA: DUF3109 domain-containing protein, partial [Chitinophagaceae bacterium]|nr:DUF3109 domain-containing protein [Chitinophagaceae bacterium]